MKENKIMKKNKLLCEEPKIHSQSFGTIPNISKNVCQHSDKRKLNMYECVCDKAIHKLCFHQKKKENMYRLKKYGYTIWTLRPTIFTQSKCERGGGAFHTFKDKQFMNKIVS